MEDKNKRRLIKIIRTCKPITCVGQIDYKYEHGVFKEIGTYIKYPKNSNMKKYLKRQSRRLARRSTNEISNGNSYRRLMEYEWHFW